MSFASGVQDDPNYIMEQAVRLYSEGKLLESARYLETCVEACFEPGSESTKMLALSNLSEAYMRLGRLKDAERASIELLACARREGSEHDQVRAIGRLAMSALVLDPRGRWDDLRDPLEDAVGTARRVRLRYWVVQNLETLGCFAVSVGDIASGFNWLQMALSSIDKSLDEGEFFRTRIYCGISECMSKAGKLARAKEYADLAMSTAFKAESQHVITLSKLCAARACRASGNLPKALEYVTEVRVRSRRNGWKIEELAAGKLLVEMFDSSDRREEALETALQVLSLAEELEIDHEVIEQSLKAAEICQRLDRGAQAEKYLRRASELASRLEQPETLAQVNLALGLVGLVDIGVTGSLASARRGS